MASQNPPRKLSDLTVHAAAFLNHLTAFQSTLDNIEDVPSELIHLLEKLARKLQSAQRTSFSDVDIFTLRAAGIHPRPTLVLSEDKKIEIEAAGKADVMASSLSFNATVELIKLVRDHVSLVTEGGCRILINIILLRVVSTMRGQALEVDIIPEFPIQETTFETESGTRSFSGVIDYLLARVPRGEFSDYLLENPVNALAIAALDNNSITPAIIEAKKDNLTQAFPQAAIAAASYCKQQKLSGLRGCVTSGEQWRFFDYKSSESSDLTGKLCFAKEISLGANLENLPLVLGLLKDLVENALDDNQKYFSHVD